MDDNDFFSEKVVALRHLHNKMMKMLVPSSIGLFLKRYEEARKIALMQMTLGYAQSSREGARRVATSQDPILEDTNQFIPDLDGMITLCTIKDYEGWAAIRFEDCFSFPGLSSIWYYPVPLNWQKLVYTEQIPKGLPVSMTEVLKHLDVSVCHTFNNRFGDLKDRYRAYVEEYGKLPTPNTIFHQEAEKQRIEQKAKQRKATFTLVGKDE